MGQTIIEKILSAHAGRTLFAGDPAVAAVGLVPHFRKHGGFNL